MALCRSFTSREMCVSISLIWLLFNLIWIQMFDFYWVRFLMATKWYSILKWLFVYSLKIDICWNIRHRNCFFRLGLCSDDRRAVIFVWFIGSAFATWQLYMESSAIDSWNAKSLENKINNSTRFAYVFLLGFSFLLSWNLCTLDIVFSWRTIVAAATHKHTHARATQSHPINLSLRLCVQPCGSNTLT